MRVLPIPDRVLLAAKRWFQSEDWKCDIMYYAGEEGGLYYFNGEFFDMSGKFGSGIPISVTESGEVTFIRESCLSQEIARVAEVLNMPYNV